MFEIMSSYYIVSDNYVRLFSKGNIMLKPQNHIITIFGASGDLTKRKLIPALFTLFVQGMISEKFAVLGVGRTKISDKDFAVKMKQALIDYANLTEQAKIKLDDFCQHLYFESIDTSKESEYIKIKSRLAEIDKIENTKGNYIFYLSTPPSLYPVIPRALASCGLNKEIDGCWRRVIVEKPFGTNLQTAQELNANLKRDYLEKQIYRIDHYLGKETIQNFLVFRFSNAIWEPLWNRSFVDYVEVTSAESLGVEKRGGYYDSSGAVCDMLQNHLLQTLAMVAMEPPASIDANAVRNEMVKVLQCLRPLSEQELNTNLVLGQYTQSKIKGKILPGYRSEEGVPSDSRTETYAALKVHIDNWRWNGVPFYIRTGKRLPTRVTEVAVHFKKTPHPVFGVNAPENILILRIQPHEGILVKFGLKEPGAGFNSKVVNMDFHYGDLCDTYILEAYERLLLDCMLGDATLYSRADTVEACWKFIEPILNYRKSSSDLYNRGGNLYGYPAGNWGPKEADDMLARDGRKWRYPCRNLSGDGTSCQL